MDGKKLINLLILRIFTSLGLVSQKKKGKTVPGEKPSNRLS